jgi:hypothetical protein
MRQTNVYHRISGALTGITTSYAGTLFSISGVPIKGKIRRIRADITAGTGATQVGLYLSETAAGSESFARIVEYSLTADPIDAEEDLFYSLPIVAGSTPKTGTLYMNVLTNVSSGTANVSVQVDIEVVAS